MISTNIISKMDKINLPEAFNTEVKYNKMIHETDTIQKFEAIYLSLLSNEELDMQSILIFMKIIERDVILVNKLYEASLLMEMTETFIKYTIMKEHRGDIEGKKPEEEEEEKPNILKKTGKDSSKKTNQKPRTKRR